ncbi:hypothetical protein M8C21_020570 [Ambrosia artemisiifolia]|uniref:Uncharacterized protein n=1 Tax=Ambrosia artemisiifolia TaxID=4212 RepID=A0AAD5CSU4_AMBAR|nr:hypothetical protein M8C21_020570 [Ambrosia artemisiifolia]
MRIAMKQYNRPPSARLNVKVALKGVPEVKELRTRGTKDPLERMLKLCLLELKISVFAAENWRFAAEKLPQILPYTTALNRNLRLPPVGYGWVV